MCWDRYPPVQLFAKNTLLLISGVSYVVAFSCFMRSFLYFGAGFLALASQAATWFGFSASAQRGALGVSHERFSNPVLWRSSRGSGLVCVCVLHLNGEKGGIFFDLHWNPDWFCHGIRFRRSLSTNLFLCVWEGGGRWMEKSDLFDWLY
jgi:hypothetical protein